MKRATATRTAPDPNLGRRARGKLEKLERIREAAHRLFAEQGFAATTLPSRLLAQNLFGSCVQQLQMWLGGRVTALEPDDERLRAALELQLRGTLALDHASAQKSGGWAERPACLIAAGIE